MHKKNDKVDFIVTPGGRLNGKLRVPGDKSISHRAIMLASLGQGESHIKGILEGEDVMATLQAFRDMGVAATGPEKGQLTIMGTGLHGLKAPKTPLDMGNSATAMRLLAGILSGQNFDSELVGDSSLSTRPMDRVVDPLRKMGAHIDTAEAGRPPLRIHGGQSLQGINYLLPVASAQVKSSLLLAGLYAQSETTLTEPALTRDHTERMLAGFGYKVSKSGMVTRISGGGMLTACDIDIPADLSSAAFFLVGASIAPGSELVLEHVGINPTRMGVINILRAMGADITVKHVHDTGGEPVANLYVRSAALKGIDILQDQIPLAIDEFPVLFVAAACAQGQTTLTGARELRVKESDRIAVMATGLKRLGVPVEETEDGIIIQGGQVNGGDVDSQGDHRVAMAFAIAGLCSASPVTIHDCANVSTSFPGFAGLAQQAGMNLSVRGV